jgi:transcriptional regulator with XRE-family HTH domain
MSVRQLADNLGVHAIEIEEVEKGGPPSRVLLMNIASKLDVLTDMLVPPTVAE